MRYRSARNRWNQRIQTIHNHDPDERVPPDRGSRPDCPRPPPEWIAHLASVEPWKTARYTPCEGRAIEQRPGYAHHGEIARRQVALEVPDQPCQRLERLHRRHG